MDQSLLPPPELHKLGHRFLQDDYKWGVHDFDRWARRAIAITHLSTQDTQVIVSYLNSVLDKATDKQLEDIWNMSGAALGVRGGSCGRMLLTTVRDLLANPES